MKGHVYRSFREHLDAAQPDGTQSALALVENPAARRFLEQEFLAASWYDIFPFVPFAQAATRISGLSYSGFIRRAARAQAERDMNGIYRAILRFASAEMVVERLPRTASRYFEFARAEVRCLRPGSWENTVNNIPAVLLPTYSAMTDEFIKVVFEAAGTRGFRTQTFLHERSGEAHGVPLVRYVRRLQWDP
jgi:hypothetical protein